MLGFDVVVERHIKERVDVGVAGADGLAVPEERCDDNEVVLGIQGLVFADEPFIILDGAAVPGRVKYCWESGLAERFVGNECFGDCISALELEVPKLVCLDGGHL